MDQIKRPVFLVTHPRSRSTAFERTFFMRTDDFICELEIFQYPFYYGPERLGLRFKDDDEGRKKAGKGFEGATFKWAIDKMFPAPGTGKRVFVKDMAKMLMPQDGSVAEIAPSLREFHKESCESIQSPRITRPNPTVLPLAVLRSLHFTFLIRHPRASIPSLYRLSQPPMSSKTHWRGFRSDDPGYAELRTLFEYLLASGIVGPQIAGREGSNRDSSAAHATNGSIAHGHTSISVVESDVLIQDPERILTIYCNAIGCDFQPEMLHWGKPQDKQRAEKHYLVEQGFHDKVLGSTGLGSGEGFEDSSPESLDACEALWVDEFGVEGAKIVKKSVEENLHHYEYLKGFAIQ